MDTNSKYERAKKRVAALRGFYTHAAIYVLVNLMLIASNLLVSPEDIWFIYPLFGWGIGLAGHYISVYFGGTWGSAWEDKKIKELMEKEDQENK